MAAGVSVPKAKDAGNIDAISNKERKNFMVGGSCKIKFV